jgi:hypothetical protein
VVTKSWIEAQIKTLQRGGDPPAFAVFGAMMVVPDGPLHELKLAIESGLQLVASDSFSMNLGDTK